MMSDKTDVQNHRLLILAPLCFLITTSIAAAQAPPSKRFSFQPVERGVMRLDTETGHVSHCTLSGSDYLCRSVADDRAVLNDEITRLKNENEALRLAAAGKSNPPSPRLTLPSEEDIDKAMGLFERMMRRMMRTFRDDAPPGDRL